MAAPVEALPSEQDPRRMAAELQSMLRTIARNEKEIAELRRDHAPLKTITTPGMHPIIGLLASAEYHAREAARERVPKSDDRLVEILNTHRRRRIEQVAEAHARRESLRWFKALGGMARWGILRRPPRALVPCRRHRRPPRRVTHGRRCHSRSPGRPDEPDPPDLVRLLCRRARR